MAGTKQARLIVMAAMALCLVSAGGCRGVEPGRVVLSTDFDSGGGVRVDSQTGTHFDLTLEDKQQYGPLGYLHFRLDGAAGQEVSFSFTNLDKSRMPADYRLLYSQTPLHTLDYQRMDEPVAGRFSQTFEADVVYIANYYPYPYTNTVRQADRHRNDPFVTVHTIGASHQGRPMLATQISDSAAADETLKDIVVLTRQHPGETIGSYQMDGMIDYVLDVFHDENAAFEEPYRFHFLPHANPDGIYHGYHRHCSQGIDFNRAWGGEEPVEIAHLKRYLRQEVTCAWRGLDLHATTSKNYTALFYYTDATDGAVELADAVGGRLTSLSGIRQSTSRNLLIEYFYKELGGFMMITEKWLYAQSYDPEFLYQQGQNLMRQLVAPPERPAQAATCSTETACSR